MARLEAPAAGDQLGPYELLSEIGAGGFAAVWLARRKGPGGFEVRAAIKLIRTDMGTDPLFRKMFLDEARLVANIQHPNVVSIFELGEQDGILFLVMEHVRGRPLHVLQNLLEGMGRRLPVGIIVRILADTCAGLHAAHELSRDGKPLQVIHRDVSPQNILVSDRGVIKLIDFGVAKANDRLAADTATGFAKGKIRYMAPEQAQAKAIDRRADIWSVGAVAYDLLEGHPPFEADNDLGRIYLLTGSEPVAPFTTAVPAAVARVVHKALTRDPAERFATAIELRTALEEALDHCGLRVTSDDVAAFFQDVMTLDEPVERSENAYLRERLAGASRTASTTLDVPAPAPGGLETLSALDSSQLGRPRRSSRRSWIPIVIAAAFVAVAAGAWRLGAHGRLESAQAAAPVRPVGTAAPAREGMPLTAPPSPSSGDFTASLPSASGSVPSSPSASPPPAPVPSLRAKPAPHRNPGKVRVLPPTARPRYDDTIQ